MSEIQDEAYSEAMALIKSLEKSARQSRRIAQVWIEKSGRQAKLIGELADALQELIRFNSSNCPREVALIQRARDEAE